MPACALILNDWIDASDWLPRVYSRENVTQNYCTNLLGIRDVSVAVSPEGTVLGFLAVSKEDPVVTALYVQADARSRGIGKTLLDALKTRFPERLELWPYELNTQACRFYEGEGFVLISRDEGSSDEGLTEVEYVWTGG